MPGNRILLDTNAAIAFFRPVPTITEILARCESLLLRVVVLGELKFGVAKSTQKDKNRNRLDRFISQCEIIPVREETTNFYAAVQNDLRSKGRPIPDNDLWIAALVLEHQVPILTQDRHFDEVEGLERLGG
ncbi:MAG: type II toxin-antitoxin system VapC family toxin [Candidatus Omnitrophica bacterium]|nr:type II toxin-antitoxin system VapC family toxin [Candidatus Omnitrophota bacterium]